MKKNVRLNKEWSKIVKDSDFGNFNEKEQRDKEIKIKRKQTKTMQNQLRSEGGIFTRKLAKDKKG